MKKKLAISLFLLIVTMFFTACTGSRNASATTPADQHPGMRQSNVSTIDPIVIRFGHAGPDDIADQMQYGAIAFANRVRELSNGAMQVQIYPASQLGDTTTMVGMVQQGELHMGDFENAPLTGFVPETMWIDLPYIIQSYDHAIAVFDARSSVSRWIRPIFADNGLRILGVAHAGFRHMINDTRPIYHPSDMENMLIRVMNSEVMIQSINAFGADAIVIPFAELYAALESGEIDGNEQPFSFAYSMRFFEVQNYLSVTGHFYLPRNYIFSETLWQQMTPAQQLVVVEATEYAIDRMNAHHHANQARLRQNLLDNGMNINELSEEGMNAFREQGATVWSMFYRQIGGGNEARGRQILSMILSYAD